MQTLWAFFLKSKYYMIYSSAWPHWTDPYWLTTSPSCHCLQQTFGHIINRFRVSWFIHRWPHQTIFHHQNSSAYHCFNCSNDPHARPPLHNFRNLWSDPRTLQDTSFYLQTTSSNDISLSKQLCLSLFHLFKWFHMLDCDAPERLESVKFRQAGSMV